MSPAGAINETLNRRALRAYRVCDAHGLDRQIVTDTMKEAVRRAGGTDTAKDDSTLRSAQAGADKYGPAYLDPGANSFALSNTTFDADVPNNEAPQDPFARGGAFILDVPETVPAIWGEGTDVLWAEGESLMIAGPMGLGKTTLAGVLMRAQLGLSPASVLGLPVKRISGKILYLAMDRPRQAARAFNRQFKPADRALLDERLIVWQGPPPADVAKYPDQLALLAEQADADVVYLDSVKDAALGLSEDEVGAGYNRARQKLIADGRQLCELHHTTKRGANGGPPKDVSDIYGSTWITNGTGSIVLLSGAPGDPIVGFRHVRQPMDEVGPWQLLHNKDDGEIAVSNQIDLVELVRDTGADGMTARDAARALEEVDGVPTRGQIEKARRRLEALERDGLLRRLEGRRGGSDKVATAWFVADEAVVL
jgi:hypothetical protein